VAKELRAAIKADVETFVAAGGPRPHLAAILVGDDPASAVYVRNKEADCEKAGLTSTLIRKPADTTQDDLLAEIARLNADDTVHGILCQLPLPPQIDEQTVLDSIHPSKDVDAFHPENVGRIAHGRPRFVPCTPAGGMHLVRADGVETSGKHAVVLGRSEIVGKPMALLLIQRGADATVTVCHSKTADLAAITRTADILIAAVGRPKFVTADMVKPGATVIDVGTNRGEDGKLVGDVDFGPVAELASAITPVPGGVGPMTRALLLKNTLTAAGAT
ncbi:MAG: bifunctional 5,10-methylenetetrahydrofolate dehydrogenase/5,10-methenyltetrahydrofolate cyclohydrolase, partial [Planctomycetota bacterium]